MPIRIANQEDAALVVAMARQAAEDAAWFTLAVEAGCSGAEALALMRKEAN